MSREHGTYKSTSKANMVCATSACSFLGFVGWASAAGTIVIKDSATTILYASTDAAGIIVAMPPVPIACTEGLSATGSGGFEYTVFYGG